MKIGEVLKALRIERGLTQEALALEVGVTTGYLSRVEQGKRQLSELILRRLCKVLGSSVAEIYAKADGKVKASLPDAVRDAEADDYKSDAVRLRRTFRELTPVNQKLALEMMRLLLKLQAK